MNYEPRFHVVLHEPEIPHNTGSVGRTCVAVGAKLWLIQPMGFQIDNARLKRAGMDYWNRLEWSIVPDWETLQESLGDERFWYFTKKAQRSYLSADFQQGDVLVFGSESRGLPAEILADHETQQLGIPIRPAVRSLNLSVAAAVASYEVVRQLG